MLLTRLRNETHHYHQQIEHDLNLLNPNFTLPEYVDLLKRFAGFYLPWEIAVTSATPKLLQGRSKSANLLEDLRYLGVNDVQEIEMCPAIPTLHSIPRTLGSQYVLEGATLGGQILTRHFHEKFDFNGQGCTFFSGYGQRTGSMWKEFGAAIEKLLPEESDDAVTSAIATFQCMHRWLCPTATART